MKPINNSAHAKLVCAISQRLGELGETPYSFCRKHNLNRISFRRVLISNNSPTLDTMVRYADLLGIKIDFTLIKNFKYNETDCQQADICGGPL